MKSPLLFHYTMNGKGGDKQLETNAYDYDNPNNDVTWQHLDINNAATRTWLESDSQLDPYIINALLAEETRPRLTQLEGGILLILRGVNLNKNSSPEDMVSIRLWIEENRIISLQRRNLRAISELTKALDRGVGPQQSGDFVCMLTKLMFERLETVLSNLDDSTDDIEEQIVDSADTKLRQSIIEIRKQAIMFRRYMAPQRGAIGLLQTISIKWLDQLHKRQLQESYNQVTRYIEDLDAIRDRAQVVKDELSNILTDRMNRNMYLLSLLSAIFLPLSFLTGLLGVNIGGIPGAEVKQAFTTFCLLLLLITFFN